MPSTLVLLNSGTAEAEYAWTDALDLAVQQAVRSVNRGLGPARLKRDLFVDRAPSDLDARLHAAYARLQVPVEHQFAEPCAVLAVAIWFLLRGIEVANVRCTNVTLNRGDRLVRLSLPVSKTDLAAKGCERSHVCICKPVHDSGCRSGCRVFPSKPRLSPLRRLTRSHSCDQWRC